MTSKNSLSNLLSQLLMFSNNSIESFSKVNEAITSDSETVTINIENADGKTSTFTIPSFGYLKNSIERLNNNINAIANIDGGGSSVRLSDGTYRKLVTMKLPSEAPTVKKLNSVNTFNIKSNYFFENMLNPLLYVTIDLTDQIDVNTDRVLVKRFLLDTNTTTKENLFNITFKNNANINYNDFLVTLLNNNIEYILDEEIVNLPPRTKRFVGNFSVIKISNDIITETINGAEVTRTRKLVKLNKLTYTDVQSGYEDTMQLAVGDCLEVIADTIDTKYKITHMDTSTNTVILELVEGFRNVKTGADYFRISSEKSNLSEIDVTVGFNEHCVVFVKPIDPNSNLAASNWSAGTGFYTNDLTFMNANGEIVTLQQFYQKAVVDFGSYLLGYAHDWYPTSSEGIKPNTPELNIDNFKVVQINKQVTDSDDITRIKKLNEEKNNLFSQLTAKSNAINELKNKIQTTNYASEMLKNADVLELQNKSSEYESLVNTYNSKVKNITSLANSSSVAALSPKYRIRGFWNMPTEQTSDATGTQAIIKFKIRYRYLSINGTSNNVEQIGRELTGSFSNYNIVESVLRGRHKNLNGDFVWDDINNNDSEEVNINQLDIPITKGEQVEIQVKAISEAGWPANPLESDWSEPITVAFPEELSQNSVVDDILKNNTSDESQLQINQTLNTKGVLSHISDSFSTIDTLFTHTSQTISSGFLSENQTPISLYTKLAEMQKSIDQLIEIIGNSTGVMVVTLSDDNGNVYELTQDGLTRVFAGSYVTEANKLTTKKGAIITKNFSINIQNTAQTGLRLISKFYGSRTMMVQESQNYGDSHKNYPNKGTFDPQSSDYNEFYRYDLVPINLYAPEYPDGVVISCNHFQSAQCKNQYINIRYKNIGGDVTLFKENQSFNDNECTIMQAQSGNALPFVWDCINGFDADGYPIKSSNGVSENFMIHIDHPYVKNKNAYFDELRKLLNLEDTGDNANTPYYIDNNNSVYDQQLASCLFRLPKNESYTITNMSVANTIMRTTNETSLKKASLKNVINKQVPYQYDVKTAITSVLGNVNGTILKNDVSDADFKFGMTHKIGYEPNDQYLIGIDTCTSYLYLNPQNHNQIQVDGDSRNSSLVVSGNGVISIPLTFQYRMTDYYGEGSEGTGRIMGDPVISTVSKTNLNNIYQANRIGFDIWNNKNEPVSFDLEIYATYGETSGTINPNSLVQYNASTMSSAVNKRPSNISKGSTLDSFNINAVTPNKKRR